MMLNVIYIARLFEKLDCSRKETTVIEIDLTIFPYPDNLTLRLIRSLARKIVRHFWHRIQRDLVNREFRERRTVIRGPS